MKPHLAIVGLFGLAGCAGPLSTLAAKPPVRVEPADVEMAFRFMNSLFRPEKSRAKIIVEAEASTLPHIPLAEQNRDLRTMLAQLRRGPDPIRLVLNSGDRPPPWGADHFNYDYDRTTGILREAGKYEIAAESRDDEIWIDIRHSPNGDASVSVGFCDWVDDIKDCNFDLRHGGNIFRFTIAMEPLAG